MTDMLAHVRRVLSEWRRPILTIVAVAVFVIGARIATPGINGDALAAFARASGGGGLFGLYNLIVGGALARGALLAIGIMPFISTRIYLALAERLSPRVAVMHDSVAGRRRLTRWAYGLTLGFALVQSYGFALFVQSVPGVVAHPGARFLALTTAALSAGALCVTWLSEKLRSSDVDDEPLHIEPLRSVNPPLVDKLSLTEGTAQEVRQAAAPIAVDRS